MQLTYRFRLRDTCDSELSRQARAVNTRSSPPCSRFALALVETAAGTAHDRVRALGRDIEHTWEGGVRQRAGARVGQQAAVLRDLLDKARNADATGPAAFTSLEALAEFLIQITMPEPAIGAAVTTDASGAPAGFMRDVRQGLQPLLVAGKNAGQMLLPQRAHQLRRLLLRALLDARVARHPVGCADATTFGRMLRDDAARWICNPWNTPVATPQPACVPLLQMAALMEASSPDAATAARMRMALAGPVLIGLEFMRLCLADPGPDGPPRSQAPARSNIGEQPP